MKATALIHLLAAVCLPVPALADGPVTTYFDEHGRGWFWYIDPPPLVERIEPPKEPEAPTTIPAPDSTDPLERVQRQRQDLERAMALAVVEPTPDHVRAYLELNHALMEQSEAFANTWKQVVWTTPNLDYGLVSPTGAAAHTRADVRAAEQQAQLAAAASRYGLLFFFRGDCPYCHQFAPVLSRFAADFGFSVIAVTLDGGVLPEYPNPRSNHEAAVQLQVESFPALYVLDPATRKVVPAVFGAVGYSDLAQRLSAAITALESSPEDALDVAKGGAP